MGLRFVESSSAKSFTPSNNFRQDDKCHPIPIPKISIPASKLITIKNAFI